MRLYLHIVVLCLCATLASAKDLALVANKDTPLKSIAFTELVKICKGQTGKWPDGKLVTFVTRSPASPEMKLVLQKVYGMNADEVNDLIGAANHGRIDRPAVVVLDNDEAVVRKVQSTPGAVGLVDVYSITGAVSVVKVAGKLPLEPGYALHGN
jgi:ABC-type phosphate transport system substrate-binding protein